MGAKEHWDPSLTAADQIGRERNGYCEVTFLSHMCCGLSWNRDRTMNRLGL